MNEHLVFVHFSSLSNTLLNLAELLAMYDKDFTDEEKRFYFRAVSENGSSLNEFRSRFNYLVLPAEYIDEQPIWRLERFLLEMRQASEEDIQHVAEVVRRQGGLLSDMIFEEPQIGVERINDRATFEEVMNILKDLNDSLKEVTK